MVLWQEKNNIFVVLTFYCISFTQYLIESIYICPVPHYSYAKESPVLFLGLDRIHYQPHVMFNSKGWIPEKQGCNICTLIL